MGSPASCFGRLKSPSGTTSGDVRARVAMLAVRPPRDRERLEHAPVDVGRIRRAVVEMDVQQGEAEGAALEAREVGPAVEPGERGRRARQLDRRELARRDREPPDLLQPLHLPRVVEERLPLLVARGVGEEQVVASRQLGVDRLDPAQVVVHLLHGDEVEPRHHLGDQRVVGVEPVLDAEVRDVPGREQQTVAALRRNLPPRLLPPVGAHGRDLTVEVVLVVEARFRKRRHLSRLANHLLGKSRCTPPMRKGGHRHGRRG